MAVVTLTTDFGLRDPYVAEMKGVMLGLVPDLRLVDITHDVESHDVVGAALVLEAAVPFFPPGTLHLAVVDPGVPGPGNWRALGDRLRQVRVGQAAMDASCAVVVPQARAQVDGLEIAVLRVIPVFPIDKLARGPQVLGVIIGLQADERIAEAADDVTDVRIRFGGYEFGGRAAWDGLPALVGRREKLAQAAVDRRQFAGVRADLAVISVGADNTRGHPVDWVIEGLEEAGTELAGWTITVWPITGTGQSLLILMFPLWIVSLVVGLGRLTYAEALSLATRCGLLLLVFWGMTLAVVLAIPLAFPDWETASFFSTALVQERQEFDFLKLYVPGNPFSSMANAVVPAVVLFSVALGVALIGVERKGRRFNAQVGIRIDRDRFEDLLAHARDDLRADELAALLTEHGVDATPELAEALRQEGETYLGRLALQEEMRGRLADQLTLPTIELPFVYAQRFGSEQ